MIRRVLVADDEPLARERLTGLVRAVAAEAEIREAGSGDASIAIVRGWRPDAVFLDVQMPAGDGFDVVAAIGTDAMPLTVFVTAYDQHAIRAFGVAAVDYLLKPFDDARFLAAWQRIVLRHGVREVVDESRRLTALLTAIGARSPSSPDLAPAARRWADRVVVSRNDRTIVVQLATVQWIESAGNYVVLHCGADQHEVRETLTSLESRIDPERFVRVHRRRIVAIEAMKELQPWFGGDQVMILKTGVQIRVSRSYRARLAARLAGAG